MKKFYVFITLSLLGVILVLALRPTPTRENAEADENEALRNQLAAAQREVKIAKSQAGRVEIIETRVEVPVEVSDSSLPAQAILDLLIELDPGSERTERRAVFYFESLIDFGDDALPVIRKFLIDDDFQDKEFPRAIKANKKTNKKANQADKKTNSGVAGKLGKPSREEGKSKSAGSTWAYFRGFPKPNFDAFPPTLRIGLLEVATNIGTEKAETLLLDTLGSTDRGIEVAYLEIALQRIAPGKHLELILERTLELLAQLPVESGEESTASLNHQARGYLFAILVKHKDMRFVENAKAMLVRTDGSLDGLALSYLRQVLGVGVVSLLESLVNDDRITDDVARYAIRDAMLHYIGQNAAADQLFLDSVQEGLEKQEGEKFNWGPMKLPLTALFREIRGAPEEVIRSRQELFDRARKPVTNPDHIQALGNVAGRFDFLLNPEGDTGRGK